jgi:hypothetical protein
MILLEVTFSEHHTVDRDAGVIRGVKVLGRQSRNGREYSDRALSDAAGFYQGIAVNLNHPERREPALERPVEAGFGWLEAVEVRSDGVYGDLHYLKSHGQAAVITEAAERNPRRFGLSHNAEGTLVRKEGKTIVESVEKVRSVDIVQNPATSNGLFESEETRMQKTIRQILTESHGGRLSGLFEDSALARAADVPIDVPAEADEQVAAAFKSMIGSVLEDDGLELKSKLSKIREILKSQEKLTAPDDDDKDDEDIETPAVAESARDSAGDPRLPQLIERLDQLEAESASRSLLESRNRACDKTRLTALAALSSDDERERLIESWPERAASHLSAASPRPAISRPLVESDAVALPKDARALALALR